MIELARWCLQSFKLFGFPCELDLINDLVLYLVTEVHDHVGRQVHRKQNAFYDASDESSTVDLLVGVLVCELVCDGVPVIEEEDVLVLIRLLQPLCPLSKDTFPDLVRDEVKHVDNSCLSLPIALPEYFSEVDQFEYSGTHGSCKVLEALLDLVDVHLRSLLHEVVQNLSEEEGEDC